jgi:hypothetical protein
MAPTPSPAAAPIPSAPSPWQLPPQPSGLLKAGTILLLVGAILAAVATFFLLVASIFMLAIGQSLLSDGESALGLRLAGGIYLGLSLLTAVGCALGFSAWTRAKAGDTRSAFVRGLVSSLLPPLQVVTLIGAILVKVSPEGEAAQAAPHVR